ncbi:YaiO family outer membrane protein [Panacagrimonas perspica]|uniref:YaiO family outer membrane protein n=1 Tax=Panacagrimonas perspica TaxID=381431 RepID=A0A4S3K895_9GAMM|nr:YaiO family outer membrane beta-barrel protein [Panacagrimonas perspica]TDU32006.1 YaiO family outer membrane protein [Panacagrimonas perspica]THD04460.1 hypothetical protein B1810_05500 [Panacagrimonas perspica]
MIRALFFLCAALPVLATAMSLDEARRLKREQKLAEAETAFVELLHEHPDDAALLAELATVQGWQGHHDDAIGTWQRAIASDPQALDHRLGLARVLYWSGLRTESLAQIDTVLQARPDHYDALLLRGDVLIAQNDQRGARDSYLRARALPRGDDDRDLAALLARTEVAPRWRLDAGHAFEDFSNARGTESGSFLQIGRRVSDRTSVYARWDRLNQFEQFDNQILAGAYWLPTPRWLIWVEAGGTPHADFRPEQQGQVFVEWLVEGGVQPLLGYRHLVYGDGEVRTLIPGVRLTALGPGDLELRYALSENIDDSHTAVASARYGASIGRFSPYLAYYDGEEALPPQAEAEFRTWAIGSGMRLGPRSAARLDYAFEDREAFYEHHTLSLGLTRHFQ